MADDLLFKMLARLYIDRDCESAVMNACLTFSLGTKGRQGRELAQSSNMTGHGQQEEVEKSTSRIGLKELGKEKYTTWHSPL